MRTSSTLLLAFVAAVAGPARADRLERAELNFKTNCLGCHSVGWSNPVQPDRGAPPRVDLTLVTRRLDEATLRAFLEDPTRARAGSSCQHAPLERMQVDDLVAYLKQRAEGPPPTRQVVPPRSHFRKMTDPPVRPATAAPRGTATRPSAPTAGGAR